MYCHPSFLSFGSRRILAKVLFTTMRGGPSRQMRMRATTRNMSVLLTLARKEASIRASLMLYIDGTRLARPPELVASDERRENSEPGRYRARSHMGLSSARARLGAVSTPS